MRPRLTDAADRVARARAQERVLRDQRPVEVAGEGGDPRREAGGELYGVPPVACTTKEATFAISCVDSWPLNEGMAPLPSVTRAVALR